MADWERIARRIRVPLGFVFAALYLWLARPAWYSLVAGGVLASAGLALRALASGHVRKDRELTTTGPYAYTRNPLYLGSMIIAGGFALAARNWWIVLVIVVLFVAVYLPVVRGEERSLRARFPEYDDYASCVPRFGIRFGSRFAVSSFRKPETGNQKPLSRARGAGGQFSCALYLQHREYNALIGAVLMMAALVAKLRWAGRP